MRSFTLDLEGEDVESRQRLELRQRVGRQLVPVVASFLERDSDSGLPFLVDSLLKALECHDLPEPNGISAEADTKFGKLLQVCQWSVGIPFAEEIGHSFERSALSNISPTSPSLHLVDVGLFVYCAQVLKGDAADRQRQQATGMHLIGKLNHNAFHHEGAKMFELGAFGLLQSATEDRDLLDAANFAAKSNMVSLATGYLGHLSDAFGLFLSTSLMTFRVPVPDPPPPHAAVQVMCEHLEALLPVLTSKKTGQKKMRCAMAVLFQLTTTLSESGSVPLSFLHELIRAMLSCCAGGPMTNGKVISPDLRLYGYATILLLLSMMPPEAPSDIVPSNHDNPLSSLPPVKDRSSSSQASLTTGIQPMLPYSDPLAPLPPLRFDGTGIGGPQTGKATSSGSRHQALVQAGQHTLSKDMQFEQKAFDLAARNHPEHLNLEREDGKSHMTGGALKPFQSRSDAILHATNVSSSIATVKDPLAAKPSMTSGPEVGQTKRYHWLEVLMKEYPKMFSDLTLARTLR